MSEQTIEGAAENHRDRYINRVMKICAILFVILLVVLHFINPQINPSKIVISYYELGKMGWMMSLAFLSLGIGTFFCFLKVTYLKYDKLIFTRFWLILISIALAGASVFYPYPDGKFESVLHNICGVIVILGFPIVISRMSEKLPKSNKSKRLMTFSTIVVWTGLVAFMGSTIVLDIISGFKEGVLVGWQNRYMMITYAGWIFTYSTASMR